MASKRLQVRMMTTVKRHRIKVEVIYVLDNRCSESIRVFCVNFGMYISNCLNFFF